MRGPSTRVVRGKAGTRVATSDELIVLGGEETALDVLGRDSLEDSVRIHARFVSHETDNDPNTSRRVWQILQNLYQQTALGLAHLMLANPAQAQQGLDELERAKRSGTMSWNCTSCEATTRFPRKTCKRCGGELSRMSVAARTATNNMSQGVETARNGLLGVVGLRLVTLTYVLSQLSAVDLSGPLLPIVFGVQISIVVFFLIMRAWMRSAPVPAGVTTLCAFVGLSVLEFVVFVSQAGSVSEVLLPPFSYYFGLQAAIIMMLVGVLRVCRAQKRWVTTTPTAQVA